MLNVFYDLHTPCLSTVLPRVLLQNCYNRKIFLKVSTNQNLMHNFGLLFQTAYGSEASIVAA